MSSGCNRRPGLFPTIVVATAVAAATTTLATHASMGASRIRESRIPAGPSGDARDLWVCADPNNLPFSNALGQGFENRIATLVAADLGRRLRYFWEPQRRGFIRTTLGAGHCDVVIGVPSGYRLVASTRPYYQSTYVFVSRRDRALRLRSFDDPRLARLSIGIQIVGSDYENPPPAQALAARHLVENVRAFTVYGDYSRAAPQRTIIDAVAAGRVDTAVVWGPLAGYFASRARARLDLIPVNPAVDRFGLPFAFEISMGVRPGALTFRAQLDDLIERRRADIQSILRQFRVPLVEAGARTKS